MTIGQVEKFTGIKPHVLRYWEEQIPAFAPRKDLSGRRDYTVRDLEIILRLKYLICDRKFTIDGARKQIVEELGGQKMNSDAVLKIRQMRADLINLYIEITEKRNRRK